MRSQKERRDAILLRIALIHVLRGLGRKVLLFIAAALAVWTLTGLDRARINYDIANGTNGGSSFEIEETFVAQLNSVDPVLRQWLQDPSFKYRRFANHRALLDALAVRAMVDKDQAKAKLQEPVRVAAEQYEKAKGALEKAKQHSLKSFANHATSRKQKPSLEDLQAAFHQAEKDRDAVDREVRDLDALVDQRNSLIYGTFAKDLPTILLKARNRKFGFSDDLLGDSLLNDQSSLHVVYHIFRLTALIIVILTFVFILIMLFQHLPFAGGTETASDQLKSLISMKSAGVSGDIARTAILSVTALGVGTAVFVGSDALGVVGSGSARTDGVVASGILPARVSDKFWPSEIVNSDPVANEYFRQLFIATRGAYTTNINDWTDSKNNPPPPALEPTINLPAPVVIQTNVPDKAGTQVVLEQLKQLIIQLKPTPEIAALNTRIQSLENQLKNASNCNCEKDLKAIVEKLENLQRSIGGPTSVQSILNSSVDPPPGVLAPSPTPLPAGASPAHPDTILGNLQTTTAKLDSIAKELNGMRVDNLVNRSANTGNLLARTGRLLSSDYYAVSDQAYNALDALLQQTFDRSYIMTSLGRMKGQAPQTKSAFLTMLRNKTTYQVPADQKKIVLERLKVWENVILSYTRVKR